MPMNSSSTDACDETNEIDLRDKDVYEVKALLEKRRRRGQDEYLACWKGFDSSYDSWEPASNINKSALISFDHDGGGAPRRRTQRRGKVTTARPHNNAWPRRGNRVRPNPRIGGYVGAASYLPRPNEIILHRADHMTHGGVMASLFGFGD